MVACTGVAIVPEHDANPEHIADRTRECLMPNGGHYP
jgi:hypothetical protein